MNKEQSDNYDSDYDILASSPKLISSLRSSNYTNSTYAVAELVDNSVDAKARHIEIMCKDVKGYGTGRHNLEEIAVLDDGRGMDKELLRRSLKFGDGKDAKSDDLGKFGMGLPNASISQCKRVEVYSWTKSIEDALHTYIDTDMIPKKMKSVPKPVHRSVPDEWKNASKYLSEKSGTLVVWSKIDRCQYKTSTAFLRNSKSLIARIYRKFIHPEQSDKKTKLVIRTASFTASGGHVSIIDEENTIKPNDPLYLMAPSETPEPWGKKTMFEGYGGEWKKHWPVQYAGKTHNVTITYSIIKEEARPEDQSGSTKHGKHAGENMGISIVRAGRELILDTNLVKTYEYRDRWWGVEIDFQPDLDEFFGVSYIKQSASNFSDTVKNLDNLIYSSKKDEHQTKKELEDDGEVEKVAMIDLVREVKKQVGQMREAAIKLKKGTRGGSTTKGKKPEDKAAEGRRKKHKAMTDPGQKNPEEERIEKAIKELEKEGYTVTNAKEIAEGSIKAGEKFVWMPVKLSGSQFFDVLLKQSTGQLYIKINTDHAAYKNLMYIVEDIPDNLSAEEATRRLKHTWNGLRLLIASWAQYEDETLNNDDRTKIQNFRISWGLILEDFLKHNS